MTGPIILHDYWRSSASYRVRIGLNLAGIAYERRTVDLLNNEQTTADHLRRNPLGLVPALEIDGQVLTQSLAILEYLGETRTSGFMPEDAPGRQRVRSLAHAIAMEIHPVCNLRVAKYAVGLGGSATMEGWMQHFIALGLSGFEGLLAAGAASLYCHSDAVSLADICLVPQVYNARRWNVDMAAFPRTAAITERLETLDAFAAAHPDRVKPAP
jgi:maleylacetoacetate isomerase